MGRGREGSGRARTDGDGESEHVIRVAMKDGEAGERGREEGSFMKMRPARHGAFEKELG